MDTLFTLLKFFALLISFLGYTQLVERKIHSKPYFSWITVFSSISCVVYFSGLLNILYPTTLTVFLVGLALFIHQLLRNKPTFISLIKHFTIINVSFLFAAIVLFGSLINTEMIHYDNFSHWALIVKYMVNLDAFPTASSAIIDFKTYPLGSSSFLYYVSRIVGYTEGTVLVAQSFLILSCFYALFGVIRDTKRYLLISVLGVSFSTMTIFNISIRINNLLVDFILPLLTLAIIAIIFAHKDHLYRSFILTLPIFGLLSIVKNSGLFFYAIGMIYLAYYVYRSARFQSIKEKIKLTVTYLLIVVLSISPFLFWNYHTKHALQGTVSKHTLSVENFQEVSSEKSADTIQLIIHHFFKAIFSLDSLSTRGLLLINLFGIISFFIAFFLLKKRWNTLRILALVDLIVVLYYLGNLAMFIYTMPTEEALILAGLERYLSSIILFSIGILSINLVYNIENSFYIQQGDTRDYKAFKTIKTKQIYQNSAMICTAIALSILLSEINGMNSMNSAYAESVPGQVKKVVGDQTTLDTKNRYFIYANNTDQQVLSYALEYAAKYFLFSPNVDTFSTLTEETLDSIDSYDYVILLDENSQLSEMISAADPEQPVKGVYEINQHQLTRVTSALSKENNN
ncbi:hypothetical protein [Marinilactibacillus kalidii]|uniref:hypothetical protein n=1 Tax=Marinilactibacillus kalidii TaxID=2820274 RepID=UPI001ABE74F3|nr:hypothetical protein [Marinilactibacillus kalidii]